MLHRPIVPELDDVATPPPYSVIRFLIATGSLMSLFAAVAVWFGKLLGG